MNRITTICISMMLTLGLCLDTSLAQITQIIDASGDGWNPFKFPIGLATDASGNVFVTSEGGIGFIGLFKITPDGIITKLINFPGDDNGNTIEEPRGVATDTNGNVYVAGSKTDNVFKITTPGTCSTNGTPCTIIEIIDATGDGLGNILDTPVAVVTDTSGNVFVAGGAQGSESVFKITSGGSITQIIDSSGDGDGNNLDAPYGIALNASGDVFVAGSGSENVFKITTDGVITEIIDATGDGGGNTLDYPIGVTTDTFGNVFVSGWLTDNVFRITPAGVITEIIDATAAGGVETLEYPWGLATDPSGNVFVGSSFGTNAFRIGPYIQVTLPVSVDGTVVFGGRTAATIVFTGVSGSGDITVRRLDESVMEASSIPEPYVYDDHWIITSDGSLTFTNAEVRLDVDEIPSPSFPSPSAINLYQRSTPGSGAFSAVTTSYNAGTNEIIGTGISSFSEFALGGADEPTDDETIFDDGFEETVPE